MAISAIHARPLRPPRLRVECTPNAESQRSPRNAECLAACRKWHEGEPLVTAPYYSKGPNPDCSQ